MGILETIALSMGIAWASGINLYAAIGTLGILGATGNMVLPEELQILQDPAVIAAAGFMYCVEFFADKVPGVDNTWDALHSFIRIPAGAVLAAMAVGHVSPAAELSALIIGGGLAATSHCLKSGGRVLINASPEPFSNWVASIGEDVLVIAGITAAVFAPVGRVQHSADLDRASGSPCNLDVAAADDARVADRQAEGVAGRQPNALGAGVESPGVD